MRNATDYIVVHCASTTSTMDIGRDEIREWHLARGFNDVGYHFIIRRNGDIEAGRRAGDRGAHALGFNDRSVGVCLVGGIDEQGDPDANFTIAQYEQLEVLLTGLTHAYPNAEVLGHRDLPGVAKACPSFDVRAWWYDEIE